MRRYFSHAPVLILLFLLFLPACTSKIDLPAITPDAGRLSYTGKFVWFDLYTTDIDGVALFYDRVFGWSVERADRNSPAVKTILHKGSRIGSIFLLGEEGGTPGWLPNLSVPNVDRAVVQAVNGEGWVQRMPEDRPYRGRMAVIRDPRDARLALLTSSVGDPADRPLADGFFMGAELWTPDPCAAVDFYERLADYTTSSMDMPDGPFVLLLADDRPRGAISVPQAEVQGSVWIPQVAVLDIEAVVQRVKASGGIVLLEPNPADKPRRTAVFIDPAGGLMGVREFVSRGD